MGVGALWAQPHCGRGVGVEPWNGRLWDGGLPVPPGGLLSRHGVCGEGCPIPRGRPLCLRQEPGAGLRSLHLSNVGKEAPVPLLRLPGSWLGSWTFGSQVQMSTLVTPVAASLWVRADSQR